MDERSFLEHLLAHPGDDATRLVYADWLEERGDPRARFLRLEVELAGLEEGGPGYEEREAELSAVRAGLDEGWRCQAGKRWDVVHFGYSLDRRIAFIKAVREVHRPLGLKEAKELAEVMGGCVRVELPRHEAEAARAHLRAVAPAPWAPTEARWAAVELAPSGFGGGEYDVVGFPPYHDSGGFQARVTAELGLRRPPSSWRQPWPQVIRRGLALGPARELAAALRDTDGTLVVRRNLPGRAAAPLLPWAEPGADCEVVLYSFAPEAHEFVVGAVSDVCALPAEAARAAVERLPMTLLRVQHGGPAQLAWGRFRGRADVRVNPQRRGS